MQTLTDLAQSFAIIILALAVIRQSMELVTFNQRQRWLRKLRKIWFVDSSLRPEVREALLKAHDGELIKVEDVRTLTHNVRMLKRG